MSTESACQFKDILNQENTREIPFAPGYLRRNTPQKEKGFQSRSRKVETNFKRSKHTTVTLETPKARQFSFFPCGNAEVDKELVFNEEFHKEEA